MPWHNKIQFSPSCVDHLSLINFAISECEFTSNWYLITAYPPPRLLCVVHECVWVNLLGRYCTICNSDGAALLHVDEFHNRPFLGLFKAGAPQHTMLEPCPSTKIVHGFNHQWHVAAASFFLCIPPHKHASQHPTAVRLTESSIKTLSETG